MNSIRVMRSVALLEAGKGLIVLLAASGLLSLVHADLHAVAEQVVAHLHLNPASRYPRILIDAAGQLRNTDVVLLAVGAIAYAVLRFVEAYGLYRERAWAEGLAAISGALYVPFEVVRLSEDPGALGASLLVLNLAVVAIMVRVLWLRRRGRT